MLAEKRRAKRGFLVAERLEGWRDGALPPRKHDALLVCTSFGAVTKGHAIFAQTPRTSLREGLACERQWLDGTGRFLAVAEAADGSGLMTGQSDRRRFRAKKWAKSVTLLTIGTRVSVPIVKSVIRGGLKSN